jgi:hypothetical protein
MILYKKGNDTLAISADILLAAGVFPLLLALIGLLRVLFVDPMPALKSEIADLNSALPTKVHPHIVSTSRSSHYAHYSSYRFFSTSPGASSQHHQRPASFGQAARLYVKQAPC